MGGVAVVTDSTSSIPAEQATSRLVTVIPLQVVVDGLSRAEDAVTPALVARALREGRRVTTSRPSTEAFAATYAQLAEAGYEAVVSAHLSRVLSGTYEAATIAAASSPVPVTVVDTATLAMATGFAVLSGASLANAGSGAEEVADVIRRRSAAATTYFHVSSLEYLRRGGRIGAATARFGAALSVKPLLTVGRGEIRVHERVRTTSKSLLRLQELALVAVARASSGGSEVDVAVHHLDDPEAAEKLAARLVDQAPHLRHIVLAEVSAVLGAHVGPGTLGVVVSPRQ